MSKEDAAWVEMTDKQANDAIDKILRADTNTPGAVEELKARLKDLKPTFEIFCGGVGRFMKERGEKIPGEDRTRILYYVAEFKLFFEKEEWTYFDVGDFIMLKALAIIEGIQKIFQLYFPDLLRYIPAVLIAA